MNHKPGHFHRVFWRIILGAAVFAAVTLIVFLLWNLLIPEIFGLKEVTYIQSAGLLLLSKILFSGFGRGRHHFGGHDHWRARFETKFGHRHFDEAHPKGE